MSGLVAVICVIGVLIVAAVVKFCWNLFADEASRINDEAQKIADKYGIPVDPVRQRLKYQRP